MLCPQYLQVEGNPQPIDGDLQLLHLIPPQLVLVYLADHSGLCLLVVEIGEVGQNLAGEHRKHQVYLPPTSQHRHSTDPVLQNCCLNGILVAGERPPSALHLDKALVVPYVIASLSG